MVEEQRHYAALGKPEGPSRCDRILSASNISLLTQEWFADNDPLSRTGRVAQVIWRVLLTRLGVARIQDPAPRQFLWL